MNTRLSPINSYNKGKLSKSKINKYKFKKNIDKKNYRKISGNSVQSIKLIPFYKCTYCNKELSSEEEKKHELLWHI
jgi:hypothetical protein